MFDGNASSLEVGQEVEYGVTHKGNKLSAECVRKLTSGSLPKEDVQPEILNGVVLHPLRCFNPEQESYPGKIRVAPHGTETSFHLNHDFYLFTFNPNDVKWNHNYSIVFVWYC